MKSNKVQRREEMNTKMKKCLLVVVMVFGMIVSFGGNKVEASEKVDINSATIEELQKLDGVGAPLAQKIIDARPYKTVDELQAKVSGIGAVKMKAIIDQGLAVAESFPEKIDINKASLYDLQFLAGVGAPLAQKIIDARPYKNLDELQEKVAGIGPEKLKAIKEQGLAIAEEELTPKTEKKISEWFPDPNLADYIASLMGKNSEDIVSIKELNNIRTTKLEMKNKNISSIEGIQYLTPIKTVYLEGNSISDISHLSEMKLISYITVANNPQLKMEQLTEIKSLKTLVIKQMKREDWSFLSRLTQLESLHVTNSELTDNDLKHIVPLTNLVSLNISKNKLTDISVLTNQKKLTYLDICNNKIKSMDVIANYPNLNILYAWNNEIEDVSNLLTIKKIQMLKYSNNRIGDIDQFSKFVQSQGGKVSSSPSQITYLKPIKVKKSKKIELPITYSFTTPEAELRVDGEYDSDKKITVITEGQLKKTNEFENVFYYSVQNKSLNIGITIIQPIIFEADKTDLQTLYDSMLKIEKGDYTEGSWNKFQDELAKTKQLLEKSDATKEELEKAKTALQTANDLLVNRAKNKTELKAFVEKVNKLYWGQDYSAGYSELISACSNAKKVIEDEDASQEEVDSTLDKLKKLEEGLVFKGNAAIPLEQRLTEARAKFLELLNEERVKEGMNTLTYSDGLNGLADVRADEQQIYYSHTRPNGSTVLYAGRPYGFNFLDECLTDSLFRDSWGYQKSGEDIGVTMFESWKDSPAHYNIMTRSTRQTHIGLSFVVNNGNTFRMYGVLLMGWN